MKEMHIIASPMKIIPAYRWHCEVPPQNL